MEVIKSQLIDNGKYFANNNLYLDFCRHRKEYENFMLKILTRSCDGELVQKICTANEIDHDAVVSLAELPKNIPCYEKFKNKLPVMCVNVLRLTYSCDIFRYKRRSEQDIVQDALDFLIQTDELLSRSIKTHSQIRKLKEPPKPKEGNDDSKNKNNILAASETVVRFPSKKKLPNEQFSDFLHLLRCDGYEDYFINLARRLRLNVDFIEYKSKSIFRYIYYDPREVNISSTFKPLKRVSCIGEIGQAKQTIRRGFITALNHENRWYVNISEMPLVATSE